MLCSKCLKDSKEIVKHAQKVSAKIKKNHIFIEKVWKK